MSGPMPGEPSHQTDDAPPHRSASTWALLIGVWVVGLTMWAFYLGAIIYLLARTFG